MEFTDVELVPKADMLGAAASGNVIQGCFSPPHDFENDPFEYVIYSTTKPAGLDPDDHLKWLVRGGGRELLRQKILTKYRLIPVFVNMLPAERAGFYRYEIETLEQLRDPNFRQPNGDKWEIRMLGLGGEIVERSTVGNLIVHKTLSLGETIDLVNEGKLLGFEFSLAPIDYQVWINVVDQNPTTLMPYYYSPGWHQPSQNNILFINEAVWNSLTPGERALIEEAGLETLTENLKEAQQAEHDALNDWKDKGAQLRKLPREILNEFEAKSQEVLNEIAAGNPDVTDVLESMRRS
jgi:TRAP-type mannitol/chloroaromatic compound transport system substrate-binding protein